MSTHCVISIDSWEEVVGSLKFPTRKTERNRCGIKIKGLLNVNGLLSDPIIWTKTESLYIITSMIRSHKFSWVLFATNSPNRRTSCTMRIRSLCSRSCHWSKAILLPESSTARSRSQSFDPSGQYRVSGIPDADLKDRSSGNENAHGLFDS